MPPPYPPPPRADNKTRGADPELVLPYKPSPQSRPESRPRKIEQGPSFQRNTTQRRNKLEYYRQVLMTDKHPDDTLEKRLLADILDTVCRRCRHPVDSQPS